jgi:hypothetical protein
MAVIAQRHLSLRRCEVRRIIENHLGKAFVKQQMLPQAARGMALQPLPT